MGVNLKDFVHSAGIMGLGLLYSRFGYKGRQFKRFAGPTLLAVVIRHLTTRRSVRLIFRKIPFLGLPLMCPNFNDLNSKEGCQGQCKNCSLVGSIATIALGAGMAILTGHHRLL